MDTKKNMRAEVLVRRNAIDFCARKTKSTAICKAVEKRVSELFASPCIAVYEAMKSEVDLSEFITSAYKLGWRVCFPCMVRSATDGASPRMAFFHISRNQHPQARQTVLAHPLRCNTCGELAKSGYIEVAPSELDVVMVPLVAFDADGNRLGYGGGNYDQLLPHLRSSALVVGVAFTEQEVDAVPVEAHDQKLSRIITA